jgi:hypothetical protein
MIGTGFWHILRNKRGDCMIKIILISVILCLCSEVNLFSSDNTNNFQSPANAVSIGFGILFDRYSLEYERALGNVVSLGFDATYTPNFFWFTGQDEWFGGMEVRFYLGRAFQPIFSIFGEDAVKDFIGDAVRGFYCGIGGQFGKQVFGFSFNYSSSGGSSSSSSSVSACLVPVAYFLLGNKVIYGSSSGIFLDCGLRVFYTTGSLTTVNINNGSISSAYNSSISTVGFNLYISLGYAF